MTTQESIWESYWTDLSAGPNEAIWDTDPSATAAKHLPLFAPYLDADLPLVDLGCGNGTQTRLLGEHFGRVIGIDVAEEALRRARTANDSPTVEYERVDILDLELVHALHARIGDANVYDRTVLHQLRPEEWVTAIDALAAIVGRAGCAFLVEFGPDSHSYLTKTAQQFGHLPKLAQALDHGIRPAALPDGALQRYLVDAGLQILTEGPLDYHTTQTLPDGTAMVIPAQYLVVKR